MKYRNLFLATVAFFAMVIGTELSRAATIQLQMQLLTTDSDGTAAGSTVIAPDGSGAYHLSNGTQFLVGIFAQVVSPNMTDTARAGTTMDGKPLGISTINTNIVGSGATGAGAAPNQGSSASQVDSNFVLSSMLSLAPATPIGRQDLNADGVTDTAGAGFANLSLTLSSAGQLSGFDVGAGGSAQPAWNLGGTYELIVTVPYTITDASELTTLHLNVLNAGLFADPDPSDTSHGNNDLVNQDAVALSLVTNAPDLLINPVPEPAVASFLALLMIGGLGSRRRKA